MSFPTSPLDGQLVTVNNIVYIYSASKNSWTRVPGYQAYGGAAAGDVVAASSYANSAFTQANTSQTTATQAWTSANNAWTAANNAVDTWVRSAANSASAYANASFTQANTAQSTATQAWTSANNAWTAANNAVDTWVRGAANSAGVYANAAFGTANAAFNKANTAITTSGGTITGDLSITGSLTVSGTQTYVNTSTIQTNDSLIELAANNTTGDVLDIGFYGVSNVNSSIRYTGLVRQAGSNNYLLFKDIRNNPTGNALEAGSATPANVATLIANVSAYSVTVNGTDVLGYATAAFDKANSVTGGFTANGFILANTTGHLTSCTALQYVSSNSTLILPGNIQGSSANTSIVAGSYTYTFDNAGTTTLPGQLKFADGTTQSTAAATSSHTAAAFNAANTAQGTAAAAFIAANTADGKATSAFVTANVASGTSTSAFIAANTAWAQANTSLGTATAAFLHSNTVQGTVTSAFLAANAAQGTATSAFLAANAAQGTATSGFMQANGAFAQANTTDGKATSAFLAANVAQGTAAAAFVKANNALANTTGTFAGDLTVTGNVVTNYVRGLSVSNTVISANNYTTTFDIYGGTTFAGNKPSTSNTTGTIVLSGTGGLGLSGSIYSGAINITGAGNGITFVDGTTQYTSSEAASSYANSAFTKANSLVSDITASGSYANSGFSVANSAYSLASSAATTATGAEGKATAAFIAANTGWTQANTATTNAAVADGKATSGFLAANVAQGTATAAFIAANSAWAQANTGAGSASAFLAANDAWTKANTAYDVATLAWISANDAWTKANTGGGTGTDEWARAQANLALTQANTAWAQANTGGGGGTGTDEWARAQANSKTYTFEQSTAPTSANSADFWVNTDTGVMYQNYGNTTSPIWAEFGPTNYNPNAESGIVNAVSVYDNGVELLGYANLIYSSANSAGIYANAAFGSVNSSFVAANSAGIYANAAFGSVNSAFIAANTGITNAATADGKATSGFLAANVAQDIATSSFVAANSAGVYANAAFGTANASFAKANNALANTSGVVTAGDFIVSGITTSNSRIKVTHTPPAGVNSAIEIVAANTKGGAGYADFITVTNTSGGATNPNKFVRVGPTGTFEIINSEYTATLFNLTDTGDLTLSGNTVLNGISGGYAPNRPGFRVYGANTSNITASGSPVTLTLSNWALDWQQGNYLNQSTGIFTAPVAGLYSVNLTARTQNNTYAGLSSIAVQKTSGGTTVNSCYIEWNNNTSMNHAGSSTIVKLAVGDTLKLVVTTGQVTFDLNDNWAVAYIG